MSLHSFNFPPLGANPASVLSAPTSSLQDASTVYHSTLAGQVDDCQKKLSQLGSAVTTLNTNVSTLQNQQREIITAQNDIAGLKISTSNLQTRQTLLSEEMTKIRDNDEKTAQNTETTLMTQVGILQYQIHELQKSVAKLTFDVQANDTSKPGFRETTAKATLVPNTANGKKSCCFNVFRGVSIALFVIIALVALAALIIFVLCILGHMPSAETAIMGWQGSAAFGANALTSMAIGAGVLSLTSMLAAGLVSVGCKKRPTTIETTTTPIQSSITSS